MTTVIYQAPAQGEDLAFMSKEYRGEVRTHPELNIVLDGQQRLVSSHADLSLILLDKPVESGPAPILWGDAEANEPVVTVGYGDDEADTGVQGRRRFNRSKVSMVLKPDEDRAVLEPAQPPDVTDGRGAVLRETAQGLVLVGVSSLSSGKAPAFTRMDSYHSWLREELQRAGKATSNTLP